MSQATQSPGFSRQTTASVGAIPKTAAGKPRQPRLALKTTPYPGLSFVTAQRGRTPYRVWFDVPEEPYVQGFVTGLKAAQELIAALRRRDFGVAHALPCILVEVCKIETDKAVSRHGAKTGFLSMVSHMIAAGAAHFDWEGHIASGINEMAQCQAHDERRKVQRRDAFVGRMQAAKAAKRTAQGVHHG